MYTMLSYVPGWDNCFMSISPEKLHLCREGRVVVGKYIDSCIAIKLLVGYKGCPQLNIQFLEGK